MPATGGGMKFLLASRPETVHWGYIDAALPPVLPVQPGDIGTIDTLSDQGMINETDPATFVGSFGIPRGGVLQDVIDVYAAKQPEPGLSVHVLAGPVYVEGAEPGDVLEIRMFRACARVPYSVNKTGPGSGCAARPTEEPSIKVIILDLNKMLAAVTDDVHVPIDAFEGITCTAPAPELGEASCRPSGPLRRPVFAEKGRRIAEQ
jgi:acetamidase/formamidase